MSREIRRVPLDYKHPVIDNPNWENQILWRLRNGYSYPKLRKHNERFLPLFPHEIIAETNQETQRDKESVSKREGHPWDFYVEYHLTGYQGNQDDSAVVHPFYNEDESWDDEGITVKDEDHLQELYLQQLEKENREFDPNIHMPSFEEYKEDELGYVLYETVSEGTPVTPVFATQEELVEYLVEHGTENDPPLRREAAENIVSTGFTIGSFFAVKGKLHSSTEDADVLANTDKHDKQKD